MYFHPGFLNQFTDIYFVSSTGKELLAAGVEGVHPGDPSAPAPTPSNQLISGEKANKVFNLKYRPVRETLVDAFASFKEKLPQVFTKA